MISFPANTEIYVFHKPVSFSCGIDGMLNYCKVLLSSDVVNKAYFLFISKSQEQMRVVWFDGQGFSLCTKRSSKGKFRHWPTSPGNLVSLLLFFEAQSIFSDGDYHKAGYKDLWKKIS